MTKPDKKYDVVVVGAGPAGSTAAYMLSKFGLNVLLIDKDVFPRQKLCGGLLTYKTIRLLERVFNETPSSLKQQNIIQHKSNSYQLYYRNSLVLEQTSEFPFHFIDRYTYDLFLVNKAKRSGAHLLQGDRVKQCNLKTGDIITSKGIRVKGKFIVGADGANSVIRKSFPEYNTLKLKWERNLATGLEIVLDLSKCPIKTTCPITYFGFVKWGYSWVFPGKEKLLIGMGGLNRSNQKHFLQLFRTFLRSINISLPPDFRIAGHPIPYGNFMPRPVFGKAALIGDAAGFVDPMFGEGIFYAQQSGALIALSINRVIRDIVPFQKTYLQLLRKYVNPQLEHNLKRRRSLFYGMKILGPYIFKVLASDNNKGRLVRRMHGISTSEIEMEWFNEQEQI